MCMVLNYFAAENFQKKTFRKLLVWFNRRRDGIFRLGHIILHTINALLPLHNYLRLSQILYLDILSIGNHYFSRANWNDHAIINFSLDNKFHPPHKLVYFSTSQKEITFAQILQITIESMWFPVVILPRSKNAFFVLQNIMRIGHEKKENFRRQVPFPSNLSTDSNRWTLSNTQILYIYIYIS